MESGSLKETASYRLSKRLISAFLCVSLTSLTIGDNLAYSEPNATLGELYADDGLNGSSSDSALARLQVSPLNLHGGGTLTLISPVRWSDLSSELAQGIRETHTELSVLLGEVPPFTTSIRLMDQETFNRTTGAPKWTNALFYRGEVMIPLSTTEPPDRENIRRAVRHEFTHAVVNALSNGRCPGWLDEGFAQWIEGDENPALRPALYSWLSKNPPIPLSLLQGGFTKPSTDMVPPAYGQSLFSATVMINTFGFGHLRRYLDALRDGHDKETAFKIGFGMDSHKFEKRLGKTLLKWQEDLKKVHNHAAAHPHTSVAHTKE